MTRYRNELPQLLAVPPEGTLEPIGNGAVVQAAYVLYDRDKTLATGLPG